jgi:hypothetical protein
VCVYVFIAIPGCISYYAYIHTYGWIYVLISSSSCGVRYDGMCGDGASQASKADVQAKTNYGWTPLHWASYNGHDKIAELLVVRAEGRGRGKCPYV